MPGSQNTYIPPHLVAADQPYLLVAWASVKSQAVYNTPAATLLNGRSSASDEIGSEVKCFSGLHVGMFPLFDYKAAPAAPPPTPKNETTTGGGGGGVVVGGSGGRGRQAETADFQQGQQNVSVSKTKRSL